jgi:hypothetical protein
MRRNQRRGISSLDIKSNILSAGFSHEGSQPKKARNLPTVINAF